MMDKFEQDVTIFSYINPYTLLTYQHVYLLPVSVLRLCLQLAPETAVHIQSTTITALIYSSHLWPDVSSND